MSGNISGKSLKARNLKKTGFELSRSTYINYSNFKNIISLIMKIKLKRPECPKKKSSPKGRLKPSEDEELQNLDNRDGYKASCTH